MVCLYLGHAVRLLGQKKKEGQKIGGARLDLPKIRKNPLIEIIAINTGCVLSYFIVVLVVVVFFVSFFVKILFKMLDITLKEASVGGRTFAVFAVFSKIHKSFLNFEFFLQ